VYNTEKTIIHFIPQGIIGPVTIPNGVIGIWENAFYGCASLVSITIPDSVIYIGARAFSGCTGLTSVSIGNGVTQFGYNDFQGIKNLTSINVASGNTTYSSMDGVLYELYNNINSLVVYPGGKAGAFTIPNSVTYVNSDAFKNCINLTSITIPDNVRSYNFPGGYISFRGCTSLVAINVDSGNNAYSSVDGVLYNKNKTTLIQYPARKEGSTFTIPNSVTSIVEGALGRCINLTAINVDADNTKFTSQDGVLFLFNGESYNILFAYPVGKTSSTYTIPNNVIEIWYYAFYGCTSLTSIIIPDRVRSISSSAFYDCTSLTSVTFQGTKDRLNFYDAFNGDLQTKYYAGGIGTYTTTAPVCDSSVWTKQ